MQPFSHNFSHLGVTTPSPLPKSPAQRRLPSARGRARGLLAAAIRRAGARPGSRPAAVRPPRFADAGRAPRSKALASRADPRATRRHAPGGPHGRPPPGPSRPRRWCGARASARRMRLRRGLGHARAIPRASCPRRRRIYAGADVRPNGAREAARAAVGRALTRQTEPLHAAAWLAAADAGFADADYTRDVAPWLGRHAGLFLSSRGAARARPLPLLEQRLLASLLGARALLPLRRHGAQGAIVLDTSDLVEGERSFLSSRPPMRAPSASSYRGVPTRQTGGGVAFAMVDRFAVIGSDAGVHDVIDTALGGAPLSRAAGYSKLLAAAPAGGSRPPLHEPRQRRGKPPPGRARAPARRPARVPAPPRGRAPAHPPPRAGATRSRCWPAAGRRTSRSSRA